MGQLKFSLLQEDVKPGEFDCGVQSINEWIHHSYLVTLLQHCYAYSVDVDGENIGYCMIMFRNVELNTMPESVSEYYDESFCEEISTVYIKYLAIKSDLQRNGLGSVVLRALITRIRSWVEFLPIRVITIDAMDNLIGWYTKEGFKLMPSNTEGQEGVTTYMYMDCLKNPQKLVDYLNEM